MADEPTGNLDSQNGQEVIALLQGICDSGKTVLLVTHNIDDARKTDMMVEIKDGVISNIIYNDEETKKAAQHLSDYDENGDLIDKSQDQTQNLPQSSDKSENIDIKKGDGKNIVSDNDKTNDLLSEHIFEKI